ncbi:MAG TPA: hypothetical protein VMT87_14360 [Vicinamibacteria bacterium]|nr:hypothetical protein [Vicinamibacteria bacterium]
MARNGRGEDSIRADKEIRSDFLRAQMRQWMEQVLAEGKTKDLFELEMWLRAFERFFRIKNQALSDKETRQLALRNWSEELRLVDNAILRTVQLCTAILTEDQVNQTRFDKYMEGYLKKDEAVDPYVEKLLRQSTPEAGLTLLREALEDFHLVLMDLVRLARIPYATFTAVGKMLYREIRRSHILALLIDKKFKPIHDKISNPAIAALIRRIPDPAERRTAAKVFLELFRLLRYLEYADPQSNDDDTLKDTILVFALITSELRLLLAWLDRRVIAGKPPQGPVLELYDSFVYCLPLELKKVINTELMDISVARQADSIRARVENSHGILKDCFQQSVVQLAQVFDREVGGRDIFPGFTAKLEQSVELRDGLASLIRAVREFQVRKDQPSAVRMKEEISRFYDTSMKYLMYRDWSGFELFFIEILKCASLTALLQIAHRFETFLMTLYREVQKRSILQPQPADPDTAAAPGGKPA